jgi:group I intron endonuclease
MSCGLYEIQIGSYFYHGSSNNIEKRIRRHKNELKNNKHINLKMQRIFNKYNEFNYEVVINCKEEDLLYLEQCIIDAHFGDKDYMNLTSKAGKPPSRKGVKVSEETKAKMSAAKKGKVRSDEVKENISKSLIGNKRCLGNKASEETKLKMSIAHKSMWEIRNAS